MSALIGIVGVISGLMAGWLLAANASRDDELRHERDAARAELEAVVTSAAAERDRRAESEAAFREQIAKLSADLTAAQKHGDQLKIAMEAVSGTVLENATKQLRAEFDEQRKRDRESASMELDKRTEKIESLVKPVGDKLKEFDEKVSKAEKARSVLDGSFLTQLDVVPRDVVPSG